MFERVFVVHSYYTVEKTTGFGSFLLLVVLGNWDGKYCGVGFCSDSGGRGRI